jgi:VWFA-related protein
MTGLLGLPQGLALAAALASGPTPEGQPAPVDSGLVERVDVRLVVLDVFVLDRRGNSVPGLNDGDFDVTVDGRRVALAGLDVSCSEGAEKPRVVLVFDYQHLDEVQRGQALELVRRALEGGAAPGTEIMIAALTGGLRLEQGFTRDHERVQATLHRMQNDATLFAGNFSHLNESGFVDGLASLFDVAGTFPGPKAVVLYSAMKDVPLEEQFRQLAAQAAASRCAVYPVDVRGLADSRVPGTREGDAEPLPGMPPSKSIKTRTREDLTRSMRQSFAVDAAAVGNTPRAGSTNPG